jgi:copper homeostasis protein (lipoprotein)
VPAHPAPVATASTEVATALELTLPASFVGDLPCADCPGLHYVVELYPDGAAVQRMSYAERGPDGGSLDYDAIGRWSLDSGGRRLVLHLNREAPSFYAVQGVGRLEMLDVEGKPIDAPFDHTLRREAAFVPIRPQTFMVGLYVYLADAGMFTECSTGWNLPVVAEGDNAALERGYAASGVEPGRPVLVNLEGRIELRPSMEEARPPRPSLVPVHFNRAWPAERCPSSAP